MEPARSGYNSSTLFHFEETFDSDAFVQWTRAYWTCTLWYSAFYVLAIFTGQRYMRHRSKFELRTALALWSASLALFSIFGMVRTVPELMFVTTKYGLAYSICNSSFFYGPTAFWSFSFTISKIYEMGDTAFIVLRKQPLSFLHWYHHATVTIYSFYAFTEHASPGRWFMTMNFVVHSLMYSYYALKAMRINVPKIVSIFITLLQIGQMIVGIVINISTYRIKSSGGKCQQSFENIGYSSVMYASYFILFLFFFYNSYLKPKAKDVANGSVSNGEIAKGSVSNGEIAENGFAMNSSAKSKYAKKDV